MFRGGAPNNFKTEVTNTQHCCVLRISAQHAAHAMLNDTKTQSAVHFPVDWRSGGGGTVTLLRGKFALRARREIQFKLVENAQKTMKSSTI